MADELVKASFEAVSETGGAGGKPPKQHHSKALPSAPPMPPPPPTKRSSFPSSSSSSSSKQHQKEEERSRKEEAKKDHVADQTELRRKVTDYLSNRKFGNMFEDVTTPGKNGTDLQWQAAYEQICSVMKSSYKEKLVTMMFMQGADVTEAVLVNFFTKPEYQGLADNIRNNREEFEPELTELAIEMSNTWVPGPLLRLMLKASTHVKNYRNQNPVPQHE